MNRKKGKKLLEDMLGYGLILLVVLAVISVIAVFCGAIMKLFGFRYHSVGSIILFFFWVMLASFPLGLVAKAFPKALLALGRVSQGMARVIFVILDTLATFTAMKGIDYLMDSVSASGGAILVVSFLLAVTDRKDIGKE